MNKTINIKIVFAIIIAIALTAYILTKLNVKTVEQSHNLIETTKDIVDNKIKTKTNSKVHDNSNENSKLHIVYEIYAVDSWNTKIFTIKYGISSQKKYITKKGNPRPQLQIKNIKENSKIKGYKVEYDILFENISGRIEAKQIEKKLVTTYFNTYGEMPVLQKLPLPEQLF